MKKQVLKIALLVFFLNIFDLTAQFYKDEMVEIPAGTFLMGNITKYPHSDPDETPVHEVTLTKSFFISKTEITQAQWERVMGYNPSVHTGDNLPVEYVTWNDAIVFCNKLSDFDGLKRCYSGSGENVVCDFEANGYRLPTDAEWEYSCRAGTTTDFYTGNVSYTTCTPLDLSLDKCAWYCGNSEYRTHPAAQKQPNAFGLYDMLGNVWEWMWDWYDKRYFHSSPPVDPKGPTTGEWHVLRGGSIENRPHFVRCSDRNRVHSNTYKSRILGFRIVSNASGCDKTEFHYPDFKSTENLNFIRDAEHSGDVVRLTKTDWYSSGAIWYNKRVPVRNGFITTFKFQFSEGKNNKYEDGSIPGADGITFVVQNTSKTALGIAGYGIGYKGMKNSLVVEFDTYANDSTQLDNMRDPNGNHIAVQCGGTGANTTNHAGSANLGMAFDIIEIIPDSTIYHAKIVYDGSRNTLSVYLDSTGEYKNPVLLVSGLDISKLLNLENGEYAYVGFTSATGNAWENHDLLSWYMCPSPAGVIIDVKEIVSVGSNHEKLKIFPNPSNNMTTIEFINSVPGYVDLSIFNIFGVEVKNLMSEYLPDGKYKFSIDAASFEPGVYFCRLNTGGVQTCKKFLLLE